MFIENAPRFNFMKKGIFSIFMTHPPIEKRIEALKNFV
jgi:Zn-dependent protease with chaperone function